MPFDLLLGGVRSGKSRLAVTLAERAGLPVTFVATATALDDDMGARIEAHRAERPAQWHTVEEPIELTEAVAAVDPSSFLVVDCLTVWTSNLMFAHRTDEAVLAAASSVAAALAARPGPGVVVSNEVGMGVHPSTELGRHYRDLLGAVNVRFGTHAARAALVMAGRVLPLGTAETWAG